ncbi:MAG TPA: O-antigen ligase family protein [Candidatus Saccharimonadales bacterium]|nr:O-antigen ligase family protein [Candidatus Saccharimonadales bacterium]
MKLSVLKFPVLKWSSILAMVLVIGVSFQGFLTVFAAHLFGHYTAFRLWDEVILLLCTVGSIYLILTDRKIRFNTLYRRLVWLILGYISLNIILGLVAYSDHNVTLKALGYGLIVNLRYLIFFLVTWSLSLRLSKLRNSWQKMVLWPAGIVILFGLLEILILPHNFLSHFGYSNATIPPFETINSNSKFIRIESTLRGANPLGAYMILPLSLLFMYLLRSKKVEPKQVLFFVCGLVVLLFSFSRSAWLGVFLSLAYILITSELARRYKKQLLGSLGVLIVILLGLFIGLRNNPTFQNYVYHTQSNSAVKTTSDQQHSIALSSGLKDVLNQPLGRGPGTSGPASLYNHHDRNPEDYYLQIAEEDGWLGIVLFILIIVGVGYILWLRHDDPLSVFLLASLIGISVTNLLLYAWSDDTLAYIWWGLAGIAMTPDKKAKKHA